MDVLLFYAECMLATFLILLLIHPSNFICLYAWNRFSLL